MAVSGIDRGERLEALWGANSLPHLSAHQQMSDLFNLLRYREICSRERCPSHVARSRLKEGAHVAVRFGDGVGENP